MSPTYNRTGGWGGRGSRAHRNRAAEPRVGYVVHPHQCNAWCRPPLHAGLTYSRRPYDISDRIRAHYEDMGYRVVDVRRASEVPPDDPRLIIRPHAWLVLFDAGAEACSRRP
jgi:hypothetical protein